MDDKIITSKDIPNMKLTSQDQNKIQKQFAKQYFIAKHLWDCGYLEKALYLFQDLRITLSRLPNYQQIKFYWIVRNTEKKLLDLTLKEQATKY